MSITICNCKSQRPNPNNPKHIYCGRRMPGFSASPLANPFHLDKDGNRSQVIQLFKSDLWRALNDKPCSRLSGQAAKKEILRLAQLVQAGNPISLFCWCAPLPCHCDVIRAAIIWLNNP